MSDPGDDRAPFATDERPYLQLADRLEDRIRKGEFGLAEWHGLKADVIRRARQELTRRNLVMFRLGRGYFARAAAEKQAEGG